MGDTTVSAVGFARAKPEKVEELGALLVSFAEWSRGEAGCVVSTIHRDLAEENLFVFYEVWASEEDLARHLALPYMTEFLANRLDYLREDLRVHQLSLAGPAPAPVPSTVSEPGSGPGPVAGSEPGSVADPAEMNQKYLDAYNARDVDGLMAVYAPGALAVWQPGQAVSATEHRDTVAEFLARQPKLSAEVRETYVVGDTAALIVDWDLEVPDAPEISGTGRGLDVLKKNAEGQWRYIISNPFGSR
ncbi:antibiotic biosynthesis monooxygenase [Frankia gtarii]|uniref:antibiotic biosynthesis monooxygenase n=1 Tax=Frankia gtarii TaxID=2950102 RepID=UPI0021C1B90A|nr:antibiotic biosynthesis monooxygenase [Frankia gtarii]